jgi:hypothetical protein
LRSRFRKHRSRTTDEEVWCPSVVNRLDKARKEVTHLTKCMPMARLGLVTPHIHPSTSQEGGDDPNFFPTTVQECSIRLQEAKRAVKDIVDNSVSQRENERRERIKDLSSSLSKNAKAHGQRLRRLQKSEDIKHLFLKGALNHTSPPRSYTDRNTASPM